MAGSKEYYAALSYGYSLVCGYRGNKAYNDDKDLDGRVTGISFPNPTYGHCIRKIQNGGIKIIDNYIGVVPHNIYTLDFPQELQHNGVYYPSHYVFLKVSDLSQSQIDRLEGKKKKLWNGERENQYATRSECVTMAVRARNIGLPATSPLTEASRGINLGIWNGTNPNYQCSRYEASQMISRALGGEMTLMYPENPITR